MARLRSGIACNLILLVTIFCAIRAVPATVYTVGDSSGWSMGSNYGSWTTDKTFNVGDILVFNYSPGHTVDEVTQADYNSCTTGNSLSSDSTGATSITLSTPGPHYFICGVSGHCSGGMKLSVNVAAAAPGGGSSTGGADAPSSSVDTTTSPPSTTIAGSPVPPTGVRNPATGTTRDQPSSSAILSPAVAVLVSAFFTVMFS